MASSPTRPVGLSAVAVGLMAATALTTLLPWTTGSSGSTAGFRHDDAFLVIAASVVGIALQRIGAKPAWIAPAFAAAVQLRDVRQILDAGQGVGVGIGIGTVTAIGATVLLIVELVRSIRSLEPEDVGR